MEEIRIQLLGGFSVTVGQVCHENLAQKSRKGVSLLTFLILQQGQPMGVQRLMRELSGARRAERPENAFKTMVSRLRAMLASLCPGLEGCIASERGAYRWQALPGVEVDVLEFLSLAGAREGETDGQAAARCARALRLYRGDLFQTGDLVNGEQESSYLHRLWLETVYAYIRLMQAQEAYNEIVRVCQEALRIDELDETLRIDLMHAMISLGRTEDAQREYGKVTRLSRRLLDAEPSENLQERYRELSRAGTQLQVNLDSIRNELEERDRQRQGPLFCEYEAFQEIYHIQMRNLERLGSTMFLGVLTIDGPKGELSAVARESAMAGLTEILRKNLRKGDIVTRFAPAVIAVLLPTVNYSTGGMVLERIERQFGEEYPSRTVLLHHRISPLGSPSGTLGRVG